MTRLHDVILSMKPDQPLSEAKGIFLVLEYKPNDLKQMINDISPTDLKEAHVKIIIYNMLCSLHFIHSAGVMHRDIKPANVLIDDQCQITLCDFGLARGMVQPDSSITKRRLSTHISSRWYRSPEIILTQENYDSKIDIWAMGCIMAELLLKIEKQYTTKTKSDYSDRFLFPGQSCFPLSQCAEAKQSENQDTNTVSINDQLIKILKVIGKQSKEQLDFIKEESIVNYTQSLQESVQPFMIESKFPHIDKELVTLLKQMLIFNPQKRPSAKECIANSIFDSLRVKALEQDADFTVKLQLD